MNKYTLALFGLISCAATISSSANPLLEGIWQSVVKIKGEERTSTKAITITFVMPDKFILSSSPDRNAEIERLTIVGEFSIEGDKITLKAKKSSEPDIDTEQSTQSFKVTEGELVLTQEGEKVVCQRLGASLP